MQLGWVKLHRQSLDNKLFKHDIYAWHVFETLLMLVDKNTGIWEGGRVQLGFYSGLKPITAYMASMRLVKAKMITLSSNNKYSTFSICNWEKFQSVDNSTDNNAITTRYHSNKNKELRKKEKEKKEKERQEFYDVYGFFPLSG